MDDPHKNNGGEKEMTRDELLNAVHLECPDFFDKLFLKVLGITSEEMDVCAGVYMKLTAAKISRILKMSERSVEAHKSNVCIKAHLKKGQRLRSYLLKIL